MSLQCKPRPEEGPTIEERKAMLAELVATGKVSAEDAAMIGFEEPPPEVVAWAMEVARSKGMRASG